MAKQSLQYIIGPQPSVETLKGHLLRCFPLIDDGRMLRQRHFYDTFDWRLYRRALTLEEEHTEGGRRIVLRNLHNGAIQRWVECHEMPRFAAQLPRGPFRERLVDITSIRAFLPVSELRSHTDVLRLCNTEGKTIARVEFELATVSGSNQTEHLTPRLQILPVRGYPKPVAQLSRFASEQLKLKVAQRCLLDDALAVADRIAASYPKQKRVRLKPAEPAQKAFRRIQRDLLDTVVVNLPGARQHIDTEFLHDLRVAVRRTRALIGQSKQVFGPGQLAPFRQEFRWLGTVTGPCRDLDVLLLDYERLALTLQPEHRPALEPLREFLSRHQVEEQRRLVQWLDSSRFQALTLNWKRFLKSAHNDENASDARRELHQVTDALIWKAYKRVRDQGRKIEPGTPAARLHRLRIHGKNLRYLTEFFRDIYPRASIKKYISELRELQQNLGDFHDFHVQSLALKQIAAQMRIESQAPPETLTAIRMLTDDLDKQQRYARKHFADTFARFDRKRNRELARRLFRPRKRDAK